MSGLTPRERADALREAYTASPEVDAYGRIWMPEGQETVTDPTMDELLPEGALVLTAAEAEQVAMFYGEAIALIRELADDLKGFYYPEKGWPPHIQHAEDLRDHEESLALLGGGQ